MMRRSLLRSMLLVGAVAVALAGCGGGSETEDIVDALADTAPSDLLDGYLDGYVDIQVPCETDAECENAFPCRTGTCEGGWCLLVNKTGTCDDQNGCTLEDQCVDGECLGTPKQCDDGKYCNGAELCDSTSGECTKGVAPVLDDGVECTVDECDEETQMVVHAPDNAVCAVDGLCVEGVCDSVTGCVTQVKTGLSCDDGDKCTEGDACNAEGACVGSPKVCDDGVFCNGVEACQASDGTCKTTPTVVDDALACTADFCDEENDVVTHTPDATPCFDNNPCTDDVCSLTQGCINPWATGDCSDNNDCTVGDHCDSGMCVPGEAVCFPEVCDNDQDDDDDGFTDCDDEDCVVDWACLPSGEDCMNPIPVGGELHIGEVASLYLTTEGKNNDFESSCVPFSGGADVVHLVTAAEDGMISVTVTPSGSTQFALALLPASCVGELACRLGVEGQANTLVVPVVAGGYYLLVDGAGAGEQGTYTIEATLLPQATTETLCGDGVDQDQDELVDCFDLDCLGSQECGVPTGDGCNSPLGLFDHQIVAGDLPLATSVDGNTLDMMDDLSGSCDVDTGVAKDMVYFFQTQVPVVLDAQMEFLSTLYQMYPALYLLDSKCMLGNELGCADTLGDPAVVHVLLGPGTYFLVADAAWSSDAGPFRLTVALEAPPTTETDCLDKEDQDADGLIDCLDDDCFADPFCVGFEGDTCGNPYLINNGQAVGAALQGQTLTYMGSTVEFNDQLSGGCSEESQGSPDVVYRMEVSDPVTITISHDFNSFFYPALYVFKDACGAPSTTLMCDADNDTAVVTGTFAPGTYFIVVDASYLGDAAAFTLTLKFTVPPSFETQCSDTLDDDGDTFVDCYDPDCEADLYCLDPYEPNPDMPTAGELALESGVYDVQPGTSIFPVQDVDYFKIPVTGKGFLNIQATPSSILDVNLELLDQMGNSIATANAGVHGIAEALSYGFGTSTSFYLKVTGIGSGAGTYELSVTSVAADATETVCDDGKDNDLNGATDCEDSVCASDFYCLGEDCASPKPINAGVAFSYLDAGQTLHFEGTTADNLDDLEGSCDDSTADALDEVYQFSLAGPMRVSIAADYKTLALYPAVYLFKGECTAANEVGCGYTLGVGGPARVSDALLGEGTYYIVVDAADPLDAGEYTLDLTLGLAATSEVSCTDGTDNEGDGAIDCCDSDCTGDPACVAELACGDGRDNDCDAYADCTDTDCAGTFACLGENCAAAKVMNDGQPIGEGQDGLVLTYNGSTATFKPTYRSVACDAIATNAARDEVYQFTLVDPMKVRVSHDFSGFNKFAAVYVLQGSCLEENEVACASEHSSNPAVIPAMVLQPGTYYVVVDAAYATDAGAYTLQVEFTSLAATETDCGNGLDDDGDLVTDCCDTDCTGSPYCVELICDDQVDNDCNGVADCSDLLCASSAVCAGVALPHYIDMEGALGSNGLPPAWTQSGPDSYCSWSVYEDPYLGGHSVYMDDNLGCSTLVPYRLYSPLFLLDGCEEVAVTFIQKNEYGTRYVFHSVGVWSGTGEQQTVLPVAPVNPTEAGPLKFNTAGLDKVKLFFAYKGDDADRWYLDNVHIWCSSLFSYEVDCGDGKDQDKDGLIDCCDPDCSQNAICVESCGDGQDNDCDGATDCCDTECTLTPMCHENCSDGVDNDCDQVVDCCDTDCGTSVACAEVCNDDKDNNCNQKVDCCDTACAVSPYCVEVCDDLVDNDCDDTQDCADSSCFTFTACLPEICDNGVDDNMDGLQDCADLATCATNPFCTDADADGVSDRDDLCGGADDTIDVDGDLLPDACEIGWAGNVWPNGGSTVAAGASVDVYIQVWKDGVTNPAGQGASISVTLLYKNENEAAWKSVAAVYNGDIGNNDEYKGTVPAGTTLSGTPLSVNFTVEYLETPTSAADFTYHGTIQDQSSHSAPFSYTVN